VLVHKVFTRNNADMQHHCLIVLLNMCKAHELKRDIAFSGVLPLLLGMLRVRDVVVWCGVAAMLLSCARTWMW